MFWTSLSKFRTFYEILKINLVILALIRNFLIFQDLAFFETAYGQIWPFSFFGTWQPWTNYLIGTFLSDPSQPPPPHTHTRYMESKFFYSWVYNVCFRGGVIKKLAKITGLPGPLKFHSQILKNGIRPF